MAHVHTNGAQSTEEQIHLGTVTPRLLFAGLVLAIGGLSVGVGQLLTGHVTTAAFLHAWLLAVTYFLAISLGALFFVSVQMLTRAGWSTSIRRLAEILAAALPMLGLLLLPAVYSAWQGKPDLFAWASPEAVLHEPILAKKAAFLNAPALAGRTAVYVLLWTFFSWFFLSQSRKQDASGDLAHTYRMQWVAAPAIGAFALSVTFFAFDYLMALEANFYSNVFGIYFFAGCAMSFLATMVLLLMSLQDRGILTVSVHREHFHDLGKLLFGFVFFWSYIAFSQYMLIWYANIPEETVWFAHRQDGSWKWVSLALLLGHFALPFPGLLSRHVKRNRRALAFWAGWLLVMEYLDLYWLVMPSAALPVHGHEGLAPPHFGVLELSLWLAVAGLSLLHFALRARHMALRPIKDPRLGEALAFENV